MSIGGNCKPEKSEFLAKLSLRVWVLNLREAISIRLRCALGQGAGTEEIVMQKISVSATVALAVGLLGVSTRAEFRTIDGFRNNPVLGQRFWGAANTPLVRTGYPADYPDGFGDLIYGETSSPAWPNPRDVSNAISAQTALVYNDRNLSDWVVQWGQFLTHDMDLTGTDAANDVLVTGGTGDFSIPINDPLDILGPNPISFNRSNYAPNTGNTNQVPSPTGPRPNWREQINSVTSFIDASNVYGSDSMRANALRTGVSGRLVTTASGLLPGMNTAGLENDDPLGLGSSLFLTGDVRGNEQVGLTATHALFVREHNRLADLLKAHNRLLTDEAIYQKARRIVGAEMQIITYEEFLPAMLGNNAPDPTAYNYDPNVDPSITSSFSTAFFRYGHSMQSSDIQLVNDNGTSAGEISLLDGFFSPATLQDDPGVVEQILLGLALQVAQENDVLMVDDLRNFLFGPPGAGGLDLAVLDIQRGRDHGMLDFNAFRESYDLQPYNSFLQLTSNPQLRNTLRSIYGNINAVDAWIGGIAEDHVPGTSVGEMVLTSFVEQFTRLRDGDHFFYTGDTELFLDPDIGAIVDFDSITLAEIIRLNTGVTSIQDNVFFATALTLLPGDYNGDGSVDASDYGVWRDSLGQLGTGLAADGNNNGVIDQDDYKIWKLNFGHMENSTGTSTAVPEPVSLVLLMTLAIAISRIRKRNRG